MVPADPDLSWSSLVKEEYLVLAANEGNDEFLLKLLLLFKKTRRNAGMSGKEHLPKSFQLLTRALARRNSPIIRDLRLHFPKEILPKHELEGMLLSGDLEMLKQLDWAEIDAVDLGSDEFGRFLFGQAPAPVVELMLELNEDEEGLDQTLSLSDEFLAEAAASKHQGVLDKLLWFRGDWFLSNHDTTECSHSCPFTVHLFTFSALLNLLISLQLRTQQWRNCWERASARTEAKSTPTLRDTSRSSTFRASSRTPKSSRRR